jgi:general stress protein 26
MMSTDIEAREKFWSALADDMTVMLALADEPSQAQPMTAQMTEDAPEGPIWFFTSIDTDLAKSLIDTQDGFFTFADKGHGLFATVHGTLQIHNDRSVIDALWNPFVAAWFEGKDDPKLCLLRFEAAEGRIWFDAKSLIAGIKMLLGVDPKQDYKDKVASVTL